MSIGSSTRNYWREEFALIAFLFVFFIAIVVLARGIPFDARLFPVIIGSIAIALTLLIALEQWRLARRNDTAPVDDDDPEVRADWPRLATALFSAPVFGLLFWLFGFVVASLAAMLA